LQGLLQQEHTDASFNYQKIASNHRQLRLAEDTITQSKNRMSEPGITMA
jgi:hypothetical protein